MRGTLGVDPVVSSKKYKIKFTLTKNVYKSIWNALLLKSKVNIQRHILVIKHGGKLGVYNIWLLVGQRFFLKNINGI